jgi:branched-chain amino acid transport system substrate-binding protein
MTHRGARLGLTVALSLVLSTACASQSPSTTESGSTTESAKVAKIALLAPLTGAAAADGEEMERGARLAVDEINAAGGVAGYQFELVVGDTQDLSSDATSSAVARLSADPLVNVFVTSYANLTNFEIDTLARMDMPYIIGGNPAETEKIISKDPSAYPTIWSMAPDFAENGRAFPRWVQSLADAGTFTPRSNGVFIITSDNPYSRTLAVQMEETFTELGWTIVGNEVTPQQEISDWRAVLSKIRTADPDVIIDTDFTAVNGVSFLNQFLENPTPSLLYIDYAPTWPEFLELAGDKAEGVVWVSVGVQILSTERTQEIQKKYMDRYGIESGNGGTKLYETIYLYADVLEQVGDPTKRLEIGEAIGATVKETALGRLAFDPENHLAKLGDEWMPVQILQIWDGERLIISPEQYATGSYNPPPWIP